jgi:class 3 adenylate cyclase/tetratricopeptide (TPR) repeat protein
MDVGGWLRSLGLEQYEVAFRDNDIDDTVLPSLTAEDLKDLGIGTVGHRRKLLDAIALLRAEPTKAPPRETPSAPAHRPQDTAERRQVTVMFSDLVGSTALSARMDPEDLREVISAYQKCVAETVQRLGGFVAKYMGDGVLVYFGYPQAHEDDAERAVRAGLELVAAIAALTTAAPLQSRVGIATGLVVVGDLIGSAVGAAQEQAVIGETPNLAARLQAAASPGTITIDQTTHRLLGALFEYRDLGGIEAKGFANRVQAYEVVRRSTVESRFKALRTANTPLVDRHEEIELLMRRWEQAKRGDGCAVLIAGEPGIGKSRIAETVVQRLGGEPQTRLRFFCSPHHQDSALYPSITQLERAAGFRREDTAEQRLAKLEAVVVQGTNRVSEAVPLLADLLSVPTGDRYPPLNLTPQKRKEKTLHAQLAQLEGLAARQPVLMLWEDVHWSDPTTREALDLFIDRAAALRVMMILTFRPEFTPPWLGRSHVTLLNLSRLPPRQGTEMVVHVTGGKALPKEIADHIVDRTDGVPLFIEELTKSVVESGLIEEADGRYAATGPVASLAIPATLQASLLARLDRLATSREIAQIGAALGRSFSHELISAVAEMPQQELDDTLDRLVQAELIFRDGTPPEAEYTFKHALVQDATYSTLLRSRRQQLHARIAATLETHFPESVAAEPAILAQHCTQAGLNEKAVGYWLKAGRRALARSATTEAVSQLQKGLDLLLSLPEDPCRAQQELDLQIALNQALIAASGYSAPAVGETIIRARALAKQLDRSDYFIPLLGSQWNFHLARAEHKLALSIAKEMEEFGKTRSDETARLLGDFSDGVSCFFLGEITAAHSQFEQCHRLRDPAGRALNLAGQYAGAVVHLGTTLAMLGYIDQARSRVEEAVSESRRLGHPLTLVDVLFWASWTKWVSGSVHEVQQHAEEAIALSNEHGLPFWQGWAHVCRGWSLSALGHGEQGLGLVTQGLTLARNTGGVVSTPWALTLLAEVHAKLGRPVEGLRHAAAAAEIMERTDERFCEAELHRVRGELLNETGDRAAAEQSYKEALAAAKRQSARTFELRAATSLARLWRERGQRAQARDLLAPIYGWFTEGVDTPVLQDAKALLDSLA